MKKTQIISFKADASLIDALDGIGNRSSFIRGAIIAALRNTCPLCGGTGALSPNQKKHWDELSEEHSIETCDECQEPRIICTRERSPIHDSRE